MNNFNKHPCGLRAMLVPMTIMVVLWLGLVGIILAEPYTVQWTEPTTREDGTYLPPEQIAFYHIFVSGSPAELVYPGNTSIVLDIDTSSPQIVTMKTYDTRYVLSADSNGVGVPLTPPVAPGICVSE